MAKKIENAQQGGSTKETDPIHLEILKKIRIMIRAAQRHSLWIEKQCGVSGAQLWIMHELSEVPGLRVGEIANKLAIHQTTTSNLLEALEKRGYVIKTRDTKDQRVVNIALSEAGTALLLMAPKPARGLLPEALRNIDEENLTVLGKGLDALLGSIQDMDESFGAQPLPFTM